MDSDCWLSQGVFVYDKKTEKASPRKRKKLAEAFSGNDGDFVAEERRQERLRIYEKLWKRVEERVNEIQSKNFVNLLESVEKFISDHERTKDVIPSAVLLTGVNMPDYDSVFSDLRDRIRSRVTRFVITMSAVEAATLKSAIQSLVFRSLEQEDVDVLPPKYKCTLSMLAEFYQQKAAQTSTSGNRCEYFVVLFENVDHFPAEVLQELILVCSDYCRRIPFVFVMGASTGSASINRMLSQESLSRLAVRVFQVPTPFAQLNCILDALIFTPEFPFKLGSRAFSYLNDNFMREDFSIKAFMSGFKFCMMEHYYANPASILCCSHPEVLRTLGRAVDNRVAYEIGSLSSFRRYIESLPDKKAILKDNKLILLAIKDLLDELHRKNLIFYPILRLVHIFVNDLPQKIFGKQLKELYVPCVERHIAETDEFQEALKLLGLLARDELEQKLSQAIEIISGSNLDQKIMSDLVGVQKQLSDFLDRLWQLEDNPEYDEQHEEEERQDGSTDFRSGPNSRGELMQMLKTRSEKRNRKQSKFHLLRAEIIQCFQGIVKAYLVSPMSLPCHEIYYFDNDAVLRRNLMPSSRQRIELALTESYRLLKCDCCCLRSEGHASDVIGSMPDVCIAYKLLLEHTTKTVKLNDWLQSFVTVHETKTEVEGDVLPRKRRRKCEETDVKLLTARFTRSVAELQFLGFVKATGRTPTYITKLNC